MAAGRLDIAIFSVPEALGGSLRFVLSQPVDGPTAEFLRGVTQAEVSDSTDKGSHHSLQSLFEPRTSFTGSGYGLTVVADFVAGPAPVVPPARAADASLDPRPPLACHRSR